MQVLCIWQDGHEGQVSELVMDGESGECKIVLGRDVAEAAPGGELDLGVAVNLGAQCKARFALGSRTQTPYPCKVHRLFPYCMLFPQGLLLGGLWCMPVSNTFLRHQLESKMNNFENITESYSK